MKTLAFSGLLLGCSLMALGQDSSELFDKAPPAIDDALRARVNKFYDAFIAGKFKDAYALVADDSQDKFFELPKDQYKGCEIIKVKYAENFTKATVVTACKDVWRFYGASTLTTFPLTSNWEVVDGQWLWHYVKPTMMPSPFSPTGFVPVPPDTTAKAGDPLPKDMPGAVKGILAKVSIDKTLVHLSTHDASKEVIHVRNDMPGEVRVRLAQPNIPGLKVSLEKTKLEAHEQTNVLFEWSPDEAARAKNVYARPMVHLQIDPTNQIFSIELVFDNATQNGPATPVQAPSQK